MSPRNVDVGLLAATLGHAEILLYAYHDGCPCAEQECLEAAERNGHDDLASMIYFIDGE